MIKKSGVHSIYLRDPAHFRASRRFETSVVAVMDQEVGKSTGGRGHIWNVDGRNCYNSHLAPDVSRGMFFPSKYTTKVIWVDPVSFPPGLKHFFFFVFLQNWRSDRQDRRIHQGYLKMAETAGTSFITAPSLPQSVSICTCTIFHPPPLPVKGKKGVAFLFSYLMTLGKNEKRRRETKKKGCGLLLFPHHFCSFRWWLM